MRHASHIVARSGFAALIVAAGGGGARAGIITGFQEQTAPFSIAFGGSNSASVSFAPFDSANGTRELLSIWLELDAWASMDVGFENLSAFPISLPINFGSQLNAVASAGGVALPYFVQSDPIISATLTLAAANAPAPNQSGPDYIHFGVVSGPVADARSLASAGSAFAASAAAGPVGLTLSAAHFLQFASPPAPGTGIRRWVTNYTVGGDARLTYQFAVVPTTGTMWLAGLALTLAAARRR